MWSVWAVVPALSGGKGVIPLKGVNKEGNKTAVMWVADGKEMTVVFSVI
jgi:hypothetical protein